MPRLRFTLTPFVLTFACRGEAAAPVRVDPTTLPAASETKSSEGPIAGASEAKQAKGPKATERRTLAYQLAQTDKAIASATKNAEANPDSSMRLETVANHYLNRARLTGDYADYRRAEDAIEKAFSIHPNGFGPFRARASLNYTLHRLDRVDADIERAMRSEDRKPKTVAGALLFAGKLKFQRGEYASAKELYEGSIAAEKSSANLAALAEYEWKTGSFDRAEALYLESDGQYHGPNPEPHAWNRLMRGLMDLDRGRWDDALVHYRDAETWLSGWYLVEEHIAEVLTLMGKTDEAKAMYLGIIERTNNPEFMDAMAGILIQEGDQAAADAYVTRARARYEEMIAMYPEASAGHALGHFLEFGTDTARAVEMAEQNHTLRPNAEAKILLAQAYLKADRVADARKTIEAALATPWSTADLFATAAEVFRKAGDVAKADELLAKAKAIDPHAGD